MPYADLNVSARSTESLRALRDLGYAVVCWTSEATGSVPPKPPKPTGAPASVSGAASSSFTRPVQECTRLTLSLEEDSHAFALTGARDALRAYDVVAVACATESILERVLQSPAVDAIDIVCLPSAHRPTFNLRPALARKVLKAGMFVELCYAAALRDGGSRRNFIGNLQAVLEVLPKGAKRGGTGLILSSGADEARLLRSPYDILALVGIFGCGRDAAKLALAGNPFKVLERAARRQIPSPGAPPPANGLFSLGPVPSAAAAAGLVGKRAASGTAAASQQGNGNGAEAGGGKRPRR